MIRTATIALRFFFLTVLLVLSLGAGSSRVYAQATITVTTTMDELADPGPGTGCSLREAIESANGDADFGGCTAVGVYGTDTIILEAGETYTLSITSTSENANLNGDLDITDTDGLTIRTNLTFGTAIIDATAIADRVITMVEGPLTLVDIIVQKGTVAGPAITGTGAGILMLDGSMTLTRSTVRDNTSTGGTAEGAGISANYDGTNGTGGSGTLTIDESTISGNIVSGTGAGGGLYATGSGLMVDITNSTISGNAAGGGASGGGLVFRFGVSATILNSTISGNSAPAGSGGGIFVGDASTSVSIRFSTIAANSALGGFFGIGGGIEHSSGTLTMSTSLVADNTATTGDPDCSSFGIASVFGNNVVEDVTGSAIFGCLIAGLSNVIDMAMTVGALMDNGGLTETQTPPALAIDNIAMGTDGCGTGVLTDHRGGGFPRFLGGFCDAGALETSVTTRTLTVTGDGGSNGIVTGVGITCTSTAGTESGDCSQIYADGTSVTMTATATTGMFLGFTGTGSASSCSASPCTFIISAASTLEAEFDTAPTTFDFGDAPDPTYPTLLASDGARHAPPTMGLFLGTVVDVEADGQPNATATGDDGAGTADEEGVTFTSGLVICETATLNVRVSVAAITGKLNGWVDFTGDGDWADANEQVFTDVPLTGGLHALAFTVPCDATLGTTFARFRLCSTTSTCNTTTGLAADGEVEDYQVTVTAPTTGSITIVKDATPADNTSFGFTEDITSGSFTLMDPSDDTEVFMSVTPASYVVTEMVPTDWTLESIMCSGDDDSGSVVDLPGKKVTIDLDAGEDIICTFSNQGRGTINIVKAASPADNTSFGFTETITSGSFTLMDPADDTETFMSVAAGSYDVTETVPADWTLESIMCSGDTDTGSTVDLTSDKVTIDLDPGETITCTFSNVETNLVINEVDYDQPTPPASDSGEFIEIKNVGTVSVDLSLVELVLVNGSGGGAAIYETISFLPATMLAAGDYFVVCGDAANVANCDLDVTPNTNLIQNGGTDPDAVGLRRVFSGTLLDVVSYEGCVAGFSEGAGSCAPEDPSAAASGNEDKGISRFPDMIDTDVNEDDFLVKCISPGEDNIALASSCTTGTINIVKAATPADDTEFDFAETITSGTFTLKDPSDDTETFTSVAAGSYDVTETVPTDWTLESIVCTGDDDSGSVVDLSGKKVTIDLDPGEDITCTFSNQGRGTINIVKAATPADDTEFDFAETITSGTFTLKDPSDDTETFSAIAAGSYDVTETVPSDWTLESIVCTGDDDSGSTVDLSGKKVTIDLDPGEDITCTFSNQGRGTINIVKAATPADDTVFDFAETITSGTFTLKDPSDDTETFADIAVGSYDVTETVPSDWTLESIDCTGDTDNGSTVDLTNKKVTIDLDPGEDITCTFSNQGRGTINIVKAAVPADDTVFDFAETITPDTFTLQDPSDDTETFADIASGSYDVTETVPSGWVLSTIVCTGDTDNGSVIDQPNGKVTIDLDPGEDITCTYTNGGVGTINIVKAATPADDTEFDFAETITSGTFTLTDPSDDTETFADIAVGSYDVTETVPTDWTLESIDCTGDTDNGSTVDLANNKVTIDLDPGEDITCTFSNQGRGTINIVKAATPADDTSFEFAETITPGTFTLTDPSDNTETFADIAAGSYDVTETVPSDWTLESIDCTGDTDNGSVVDLANNKVTIDLDPGEDITCTFTDQGRGTINIVKAAIPADDTVFDFAETITPGTFTLQDPSDDTETFADIAVGSYDVTETLPSGWMLSTIVCTGDTDNGSVIDQPNGKVTIDLDVGEDITCTFSNDGRGMITIVKEATPEDDTSFEFAETITPGTFTLKDPSDNTEVFANVNPGSYDVTETVPSDWTLESIDCTGDTDNGSVVDLVNNKVTIDLDPGEQITCTFSNQGRGTINIVKEATPEDDTVFDFAETITPGTFTLQDPSDDTETFADIAAGSYDVTETVPSGWVLSTIICTGDTDNGSVIDQPNGKVTIDLDPGEDITCTFTNDGPPIYNATKTATFDDSDGDMAANPDDVITYEAMITNTGGTGLNSTFTDTIDPNAKLNCATLTTDLGSVDSCDENTGTLVIDLGDVANGATATITFEAQLNNPVPAGTSDVQNQGFVSADNIQGNDVPTDGDTGTVCDPAGPTGCEPTVTPVIAAPDMALTKDDGGVTVMPGEVITYTLTYTNNGDEGATGVKITETVPANTMFTGSGWTCVPNNMAGSTCTLTVAGEVAGGGGTGMVDFEVTVIDPVPAGVDEITNEASVEDDSGDDPNLADNDASDTTPLRASPRLVVAKMVDEITEIVGSPGADPGDKIKYTVTITNIGNQAATGVTFTDTVDPNTSLDCTSIMPAPTSCTPGLGGSFTVDVGTIAGGGASVTIMFVVDVDSPFPKEVFEVVNQGTVSGDDFDDIQTDDPATAVTGDATATEINAADLKINKTLIDFSGAEGATFEASFLLTVTNKGPHKASGVFVSDPLPVEAMFVSGSTTDYDPDTGLWTIGELDIGASVTLTITLKAEGDNDLVNIAEVFADQPDPDCDNNLTGSMAQHDGPNLGRFRADLSLTKTVDNASPALEALITYTIMVTNGGPVTTSGIVVRDRLPAGLEFVSATTSTETTCSTCVFSDSLWFLGHLPVGATATLTITARVTGTGEIINTAEVIASHLPDLDSVVDNGDSTDDDQDSVMIDVPSGKATSIVGEGGQGIPTAFELSGNYPNPFNPETVIPFGLPQASHVRLEVYNLLGQRVASLVDEPLSAGRHTVTWYAVNEPSGVYLVRLVAGKVQKVQRLTLVK